MKPLGWGLDEENFFTKLPYCKSLDERESSRCISIDQVKYGNNWCTTLCLRNMPGDCGTLILAEANNANQIGLERVKEVASLNGFDTVFATIVLKSRDRYNEQLDIFKNAGWTVACEDRSNRKYNKFYKAMLILYINDCVYKGYSGD